MAIFTDSAGAALARAIQQAGLYVAWGRGNPAWDAVAEPEPVEATALVHEVGRRQADNILFCEPDPLGEIEVEGGRYTVVSSPTSFLYVAVTFDKPDASDDIIREAGIFTGTKLAESVPPTKQYFVPADVVEPGVLLLLERFARRERNIHFDVRLHFVMSL